MKQDSIDPHEFLEFVHDIDISWLPKDLKLKDESLLKQKNQLKEWKEKYHSLKIANTFLGSDDKSLTKLKINNLINELDKCILSLSS